MHRLQVVELDSVYGKSGCQVPLEPGDTALVRHVAALHEEVTSTACDVGGVEHRLELGRSPHPLLTRAAVVEVRVELGRQQGLRSRRPTGSPQEVLPDQAPVGAELEVPVPIGRRRFDDLVADDDQDIPGTRLGLTARHHPVRRSERPPLLDRVRAPDGDALRFEDFDELLELAPSVLGDLATLARPPKRRLARGVILLGLHPSVERHLPGGVSPAIQYADDHFLERVPLVERVHHT